MSSYARCEAIKKKGEEERPPLVMYYSERPEGNVAHNLFQLWAPKIGRPTYISGGKKRRGKTSVSIQCEPIGARSKLCVYPKKAFEIYLGGRGAGRGDRTELLVYTQLALWKEKKRSIDVDILWWSDCDNGNVLGRRCLGKENADHRREKDRFHLDWTKVYQKSDEESSQERVTPPKEKRERRCALHTTSFVCIPRRKGCQRAKLLDTELDAGHH